MGLKAAHLLSMATTLALVTAVGVYSGRRIKSAGDFSLGGRRTGPVLVAATIMGTLVGGASTIGTAQLAFRYGLSAWWFTLGGGIACLILGLFLAKPLRETENETMPELLGKAYGGYASVAASLFSSVGTFHLVAQVLSAVALLTSMLSLPPWAAAVVAAALMVAYVVFGGVWGTGLVGVAKLALLYGILLITSVLAYTGLGGWQGLRATFPAYPWFSLLGRGVATDLAAGFSLIVGVLSTQTYIQAMFSARSVEAARSGALLAAFLIPPAGIPGILVGLFMRKNFPDLEPAQAFPAFVLRFLPPHLAGVALTTLLVAVVGTGAGWPSALAPWSPRISTGVTFEVLRDRSLLISRLVIVAVTGLSVLVVLSGNLKSLILEWTYLSMGLRGATVCLPLLAALFWPGRIAKPAARLAIVLGPLTAILWKVGGATADPLYPGLLVSFLILAFGTFRISPGAARELKQRRT